jgi:hypothetical protein
VPESGRQIAAGLLFAGLCSQAWPQSIYTCVDAKGRRLTADRPIAECLDREQKELAPSGTLRRRIGPVPTAEERAAEEEKARKLAEERTRVAEEKKRDRALLARYPDRTAHDKERGTALQVADDAIAAAQKSATDLKAQRGKLHVELEFYKGDTAKVPPQLKRQVEENQHHLEAQERFIANQVDEKKRINARFDEELAKLRQLWAQRAAPATAAAGAGSAPKR